MRFRAFTETLATYLTVLSALVLPLLMVVWARSYMVNDRYLRVAHGHALMLGVSNGEVTLWHAPAAPETQVSDHRARETSWGWSYRRSFQRFFNDHIWFAGFAYAQGARMPWRSNIVTTGTTRAICFPLWLPALLFGILPMRLIARNMQSSADFLAQRAATEALENESREAAAAAAASPSSRTLPSPIPAA
jgi:hypothetical protein